MAGRVDERATVGEARHVEDGRGGHEEARGADVALVSLPFVVAMMLVVVVTVGLAMLVPPPSLVSAVVGGGGLLVVLGSIDVFGTFAAVDPLDELRKRLQRPQRAENRRGFDPRRGRVDHQLVALVRRHGERLVGRQDRDPQPLDPRGRVPRR
jgi:hypothetical protein